MGETTDGDMLMILATAFEGGPLEAWSITIWATTWLPVSKAWSRTCAAAAPKSVPCGATRTNPTQSQNAERMIMGAFQTADIAVELRLVGSD